MAGLKWILQKIISTDLSLQYDYLHRDPLDNMPPNQASSKCFFYLFDVSWAILVQLWPTTRLYDTVSFNILSVRPHTTFYIDVVLTLYISEAITNNWRTTLWNIWVTSIITNMAIFRKWFFPLLHSTRSLNSINHGLRCRIVCDVGVVFTSNTISGPWSIVR